MSGVPWKTKRQTGHRVTRGLKHHINIKYSDTCKRLVSLPFPIYSRHKKFCLILSACDTITAIVQKRYEKEKNVDLGRFL